MKTIHLLLLSLLSALLLSFSWFPNNFLPFIFVAFIPLLIVEHAIFQNPKNYKPLTLFTCSFFTFLLWNVLTTWWIKNASVGGSIMAIIPNSLLMTMVFMFFHKTKKRVGEKWGVFIFVCYWITFEFLHQRWDLSWPWLTLGNAFADAPEWIQWYEFTGVFGGSLWVLLVNVLLFQLIERAIGKKTLITHFILVTSILILPLLISVWIKTNFEKNTSEHKKKYQPKIVIVQPNIDPYNEKFNGSFELQLKKMIQLAIQKTDSTTDYLVLPETALTEDLWENELNQSRSIKTLKAFIKQYPKLNIIIGASTAKFYSQDDALSVTARKFTDADSYYDAYNTALQINNSENIQIYHKSKLVPGVERMPYPFVFKYLEKFAIGLGGTIGSLGIQEYRSTLTSKDGLMKAAPVVCYESIYGEYVTEYIMNGANFISIITNDGWWGDTPGYKQHLKYGALRAIETRRWIVRSANTGISCFINPVGEILQPTDWWKPAVIDGNIELLDTLSFYTRFGDYIARIAVFLTILLIIYSTSIRYRLIKKQ